MSVQVFTMTPASFESCVWDALEVLCISLSHVSYVCQKHQNWIVVKVDEIKFDRTKKCRRRSDDSFFDRTFVFVFCFVLFLPKAHRLFRKGIKKSIEAFFCLSFRISLFELERVHICGALRLVSCFSQGLPILSPAYGSLSLLQVFEMRY